jgi:hypothetical protein
MRHTVKSTLANLYTIKAYSSSKEGKTFFKSNPATTQSSATYLWNDRMLTVPVIFCNIYLFPLFCVNMYRGDFHIKNLIITGKILH